MGNGDLVWSIRRIKDLGCTIDRYHGEKLHRDFLHQIFSFYYVCLVISRLVRRLDLSGGARLCSLFPAPHHPYERRCRCVRGLVSIFSFGCLVVFPAGLRGFGRVVWRIGDYEE